MILFKCIKHRAAYERAHPAAVAWQPAKRGLTCDVDGCPRRADATGEDGYAVGEATRALVGAASKRAWANPEVRVKKAEAAKRAWASAEIRARHGEATKRKWADPEVRAKIIIGLKRALSTPEARARKSAASKKAWAAKAALKRRAA